MLDVQMLDAHAECSCWMLMLDAVPFAHFAIFSLPHGLLKILDSVQFRGTGTHVSSVVNVRIPTPVVIVCYRLFAHSTNHTNLTENRKPHNTIQSISDIGEKSYSCRIQKIIITFCVLAK